MKRIAILTEGGQNIGFGHIARCLPIYFEFKKNMNSIEFIVKSDDTVANFFQDVKYRSFNWIENHHSILDELSMLDLVIIDSLLVTKEVYGNIVSRCKKVAVIDDIGLRDYCNNEIILNWLVGENYNNNETYHLLGSKFVPLRKKFQEQEKKAISDNIEEVVITLGGTDIRDLTIPLIDKILNETTVKKVTVFVASGFHKKERYQAYYNNCRVEILNSPTDDQMICVLRRADVAIATGGHTIYELASVGIPTLQFLVVDNQAVSENWKYTGFTHFIGWYTKKTLLKDIISGIKLLERKDTRTTMSQLGQSIVDGKGVFRIVERLRELI